MPTTPHPTHPRPADGPADLPPDTGLASEEGSLVAEYGLLAVGGAAVCGALIKFAGTNALHSFFTSLLQGARNLVS